MRRNLLGRNAIALTLVGGAFALLSHTAFAATTEAQLADPNYLPDGWMTTITSLNDQVTKALQTGSGKFMTYADVMLVGSLLIFGLLELFKYVQSGRVAPLIEAGVNIIMIWVAFTTYNTWTYWLFGGAYSLGDMVQQSALNTSGLTGPAVSIAKSFAAYTVSGGWTSALSPYVWATATLSLIAVGAVTGASFLTPIWPCLVFGVAKMCGPIFFPFLLHERTSFLFDGWFRLLMTAAVGIFVGRVALVVVSLFVGNMLGAATSADGSITIDATEDRKSVV